MGQMFRNIGETMFAIFMAHGIKDTIPFYLAPIVAADIEDHKDIPVQVNANNIIGMTWQQLECHICDILQKENH